MEIKKMIHYSQSPSLVFCVSSNENKIVGEQNWIIQFQENSTAPWREQFLRGISLQPLNQIISLHKYAMVTQSVIRNACVKTNGQLRFTSHPHNQMQKAAGKKWGKCVSIMYVCSHMCGRLFTHQIVPKMTTITFKSSKSEGWASCSIIIEPTTSFTHSPTPTFMPPGQHKTLEEAHEASLKLHTPELSWLRKVEILGGC